MSSCYFSVLFHHWCFNCEVGLLPFHLLGKVRVKQTYVSAWKYNHHLLYYCYGEICSEFQIINFQVNFWKLSARLIYIWVIFADVFPLFYRQRQHASQIRPDSPCDPRGSRCLRKGALPSRRLSSAPRLWVFGFLEHQIHGDTPSPVRGQKL